MGKPKAVRYCSGGKESAKVMTVNRRLMKFDSSGITRLRDTQLIFVNSEMEVFKTIGLGWVEPTPIIIVVGPKY